MKTLSKTVFLNSCSSIGCNILVYDRNEEALKLIKSIASNGNIVVPKKEVVDVLTVIQNTDFKATDICAIFLTEAKDSNDLSGLEIARKIHSTRNNIPIFMRLEGTRTIADLEASDRKVIAGCYNTSNPVDLKECTDKFLYGFHFPKKLVDIFIETGSDVLQTVFSGCEIKDTIPFLVYDHFITTEYTSILPVQFSFGNGILTLLIKEDDTLKLVANGLTALNRDQMSSDHLNQLISEVMNLYWGRVRFASEKSYGSDYDRSAINIPIVVNHKSNYINFGNKTPQLCFRYVIAKDDSDFAPIIVEFKMMFYSILRPEDFAEITATENLIDDNGFFELF